MSENNTKVKPFIVAAFTQGGKDKKPEIVLEPTMVLAVSESAAMVSAGRMIAEDVDMANCEVLVRPF